MIKSKILALVGALGGFIACLFGGWDTGLKTLCVCMICDYLTGLICAGVFHNSNKTDNGALSSRAGFKGLCKKSVVLFLVLIGHRIDLSIGTDYVRDGLCIAFAVNEIISIVENAGLMGIPIPKILTNMIEILKRKGDNENE